MALLTKVNTAKIRNKHIAIRIFLSATLSCLLFLVDFDWKIDFYTIIIIEKFITKHIVYLVNNPKDNKQKVCCNTYWYINNQSNRIKPHSSITYTNIRRKTVYVIFIIFHRKRYYNCW